MFNETLSEDLVKQFLINFQEIFKRRLFAAKKGRQCYTEMSLWRQRNEEVLALGISLGKRKTQLCVQMAANSITSLPTVVMCSRARIGRGLPP